MKRITSYWLVPFEFSEDDRRTLRSVLKDKSDAFIETIAEECAHFVESSKAEVLRPKLLSWRNEIARLGTAAADAASSMRVLDDDCARLLDMGLVLETHRTDSRESTLRMLDDLARACARVTAFPEFNPKEGAPIDFDKRRLTRHCAAAYQRLMGKAASASPNGTFARAMLIVLQAVGAITRSQTTISGELLKAVLAQPIRKVTHASKR